MKSWLHNYIRQGGFVHKLFFQNLQPGTILYGHFELVRCLNAGDLGGVYLCNDLRAQCRKVALKIVATAALQDKDVYESFQRETRVIRSVSHPNVIRGEELFQDDEFSAFTMEYVEGGTLLDYQHKHKVLSVDTILDILTQLARGIAAIHDHGIIHRDLKPENILISREGVIKIADFGIAAPDGVAGESLQDHLIGTVNYLSPEYIERGEYDQRSDMYAFGVIAYELMTGQLPFWGDSLIDSLTSRVRFDPVSPRELRADIPRTLSDLALRCMKRAPARRFQSMKEVLHQLDLIGSILRAIPESAAVQAQIALSPERFPIKNPLIN